MYGAGIRPAALAACLLAGLSAGAAASDASSSPRDPGGWRRVNIADAPTRRALHQALEGAARWLGAPACQAVFSDFQDAAGRRLDGKLADLGVSPEAYLRLVVFMDGTDLPACERDATLAVTAPGSRVVFVCGRQFVRESSARSRHATAVAVHEALHSLGLAENPPTSAEITAQVLRRCSR
jgi:hypothetical protein